MGHCLTINNVIFMQTDFKYADLLNDEVFKLVFGQESSKDVMIEFLNQVISDRTIVHVDFMDKEMHPGRRNSKGAVYDLLCETDDGSKVIVELQRRKQDSYAERMLYYSMHQILRQVEAGENSFDFCPVYVISILNFTLEQNAGIPDVRTVYRLYEERYDRLLTDRVTYIFLELPKFTKEEEQLDGNVLDGMYFCLRNMTRMVEKPKMLTHNVFDKIFSITELYNMDEETRLKILDSMTTERDLRNQFAYVRKEGFAVGREEGREEGRAEGRAEEREVVAKRMLAAGLSVEQVAEIAQISIERAKDLQTMSL